MHEKLVEFKDKQGRKIVGTLSIPEWTKPLPVVILCHGFKGDRNQDHLKIIAQALTRMGLATLRFDFTENPGESSLPFEDMTISYELEVLDQAINFVKTQKEIDPKKIGLAGHSLGGLVVSWYSATHPEIKALAPLSAVYSFTETFERYYGDYIKEAREKGFGYVYSRSSQRNLKLNKSFYDDGVSYEMDKEIENISCPIMVLCGTNDGLLSHTQNYFDRVQFTNKQLKIIKGSDHDYTKPEHLKEVCETVSSWFAKILL